MTFPSDPEAFFAPGAEPAPLARDLDIAILGSGVAGTLTALALARKGFRRITVYESARQLGEVGAGINVTPNLARVLRRLGAFDEVEKRAVALESYKVLESETDEVLTHVDLSYIKEEHNTPFLVVHRSDLQKGIIRACQMHPGAITFKLAHTVMQIEYAPAGRPTRFLIRRNADAGKEGDKEEVWLEADVVIGADGIRSVARRDMLRLRGEGDHIVDTGQAAYRILLTRAQVQHDPELLALLDGKTTHRWIGEKRHIISYPISGNEVFNISTAHPDTHFSSEPSSTWTATGGTKAELLDTFKTFCPRVQKLLSLVPEDEPVLEWRLRVHEPLESWVQGDACLAGDACHPTLPHLAQGAAQAAEDAITLGVALSLVRRREDVHRALELYESIRKPRAERAVAAAAENGKGLHLSSGADRAARDAKFREADVKGGTNPDKQVDRVLQRDLYGYDVAAETHKEWERQHAGSGQLE